MPTLHRFLCIFNTGRGTRVSFYVRARDEAHARQMARDEARLMQVPGRLTITPAPEEAANVDAA